MRFESVSRIHRLCWNKVCITRMTTIEWCGEYFSWNSLMGEIFPPHTKCTRTRGLPLKSHVCLQKISVFDTKYHLNLLRILLYKEIQISHEHFAWVSRITFEHTFFIQFFFNFMSLFYEKILQRFKWYIVLKTYLL